MRKVNRDGQPPEIAVEVRRYPQIVEVAIANPYAPSTALYRLTADVVEWLDGMCKGKYSVKPGNTFIRVTFSNERDATLFWTAYG